MGTVFAILAMFVIYSGVLMLSDKIWEIWPNTSNTDLYPPPKLTLWPLMALICLPCHQMWIPDQFITTVGVTRPTFIFFPSALLPYLKLLFCQYNCSCFFVASHISDLLSMSPHLCPNVWPPIEHEVAIILSCNTTAPSYYCVTVCAGVLIMLSL